MNNPQQGRSVAPSFLAAMTYEQAKAHQEALFAASKAAGDVLRAYPKGPMGLTPDEVKASPQWRAERAASDRAFAEARDFNAWLVKTFAREYRAERAAKVAARTKP